MHDSQMHVPQSVGQPALTMGWVPVTDPHGHTRLEAHWTAGPISATDRQPETHAA